MRKYELVCLIQPDLDEAAFNGVLDRVKGWVTESGGTWTKWMFGASAGSLTQSASNARANTCSSTCHSRQPRLPDWNRTCVTPKRSCGTC